MFGFLNTRVGQTEVQPIYARFTVQSYEKFPKDKRFRSKKNKKSPIFLGSLRNSSYLCREIT